MNDPIDVRDYNRRYWDRAVETGDRWTRPVTPDEVAAARRGEWQIVLTETRSVPIPREWLGLVAGRDVLCLASGGGQQGPILAAAGARHRLRQLAAATGAGPPGGRARGPGHHHD